jgi:hypothetical protein
MSKPYGITAALAVGMMAAVLTLALPVEAQLVQGQGPGQVPVDAPATAPAVKPADSVSLTMEQRHIIKEIIVKDMKIAEPQGQAKLPTQVGQIVPAGIPLQPMPVEVAAKVPQLKSHSFLVKDDKVLIIDPKDNKVAALIE